jgi:hypothetical protein
MFNVWYNNLKPLTVMYPVRYVGEIYFECSVKIMYIYLCELHVRENRRTNPLATLGRQDTERRQTKHKTHRRKRYLGEWNVRECRMNNTESHWTQRTDIKQNTQINIIEN